MSNFSYLSTRPEYSLFANSAIEAEKVFSTSPAMCAVGCRKALELAVKWVYAADKTITMPYKDNLQSLLHEPSFRFAVDRDVWSVLPSIVKAAIWRYIQDIVCRRRMQCSVCGGCSPSSSGWITATARTMWSAPLMKQPSPARKWRWTKRRSGSRKAC